MQDIRESFGLESCFVIGNFARHTWYKGQDYLLRAFAQFVRDFPDARLLMVGDGPYHRELRLLAGELSVDHQVVFTGWQRDARRLMSAVDVIVHPTLHESFCQVMVEAMTKAKPLVITNVAGPCDQVQHLRTGFIIPMRDSDAIYDALRWLRKHPEEARQLGKQGREYVLQELDIRRVIPRYETCYKETITRGA